MFITKRNGSQQSMQFDKITKRLHILIEKFNIKNVDPVDITRCIAIRLYSGISSQEIDDFACQWLVSKSHESLNYQKLASVLSVSNLHKETSDNILTVVETLYNHKNKSNNHSPLISEQYYNFVLENTESLKNVLDYNKDYSFDYFGLNTLKKAYLIKQNNKIIERPQHMYMRVAIALYAPNLEKVIQCYKDMSDHLYTHATPTLYNAGTKNQNCASCYLIGIDDSTTGIYKTISDCAQISKAAGGIGIHMHDVRAKGSYINSTGGESNGLLPMLKVFDATARHINQSNKRNGSFACYLEPHHPDLISFLHAKRPQGTEEERARDLFYALWISDLFMERVRDDKIWSFMCPNVCKGLSEVYGDEYKKLYEEYEEKEMFVSQMPARKVWENIITCQIESGVPYMSYKDASNKKSNQKNIGTIKSSNLCNEISQVSTPDEPSVCNLASISLKKILTEKHIPFKLVKLKSKDDCFYCNLLKHYLNEKNISYEIIDTNQDYSIIPADYNTYPKVVIVNHDNSEEFIGGFTEMWDKYLKPNVDYEKLKEISYKVTENLNRVIDINDYPLEGAKKTNMERRPLGIGVQGLADMFALLLVDFDSDEAKELNKKIFETIYFGSMQASIDLAKEQGPYLAYQNSPLSQGLLQYNLWGLEEKDLSGMWDWITLKDMLQKYGARNSLLTALMPTASTSQIMANNECFEAFTSNLYTRSTIAGDFVMVNKYLFNILENTNTWSKTVQDKLVFNRGSVQNISEIPKQIRNVFKTIWEISQKKYIELSAERAPFICQSQSLNLWFKQPNFKNLYKAHMLGWQLGLKTGSYYIRTLPAGNAARLGMNAQTEKELQNEVCESCSG